MTVLISGAGITGPALPFWLRKYGFAPTLVETAPALRTRGYVIDFCVVAGIVQIPAQHHCRGFGRVEPDRRGGTGALDRMSIRAPDCF